MLKLDEIISVMEKINGLPKEFQDRIISQSFSALNKGNVTKEIMRHLHPEGIRVSKFFWGKRLNKDEKLKEDSTEYIGGLLSLNLPSLLAGVSHCKFCDSFAKGILKLNPSEKPDENEIRRIFGACISELDKSNIYYINYIKDIGPLQIFYELTTNLEKMRTSNEDGRWFWGLVRSDFEDKHDMRQILLSDKLPECPYCVIFDEPKHEKHIEYEKDWEHFKSLMNYKKSTEKELKETRKLKLGILEEKTALIKRTSELEDKLQRTEKILKEETEKYAALKEELSKPEEKKEVVKDTEYLKAVEGDVLRLEQEKEDILKDNKDKDLKISALLSTIDNLQEQIEIYERKVSKPQDFTEEAATRAKLSMYYGRKVVVVGGHKDQYRNIMDILLPLGAKLEHIEVEHDGSLKNIPQKADLIIIYARYIDHKTEQVIKSRASHLDIVRFYGSKATLPDFLADNAEKHFHENLASK